MLKEKAVRIVERINVKTWIVVYIVVMTLPILYFSFFSFPYADDFSFSLKMKQVVESGNYNLFELIKTAFAKMIEVYYSWQGTYSATFFSSLQPGIFGEQYYFSTIWILLFLSLFAFLFCGNKILTLLKVAKKRRMFFSLLTWFFYIQTMPNPREGLFWFNGGLVYVGFFSVLLINFSMILSQYFSDNKKFKINNIISITLAFIVSGAAVPVSFLNFLHLTILLLSVLIVYKEKYNIKAVAYPFLSATIGFIVMAIAPGNRVRAELASNSKPIIETVFTVVSGYFNILNDYWINISFILFLLLLTPIIVEIIKNVKGFKLSCFIFFVLVQFTLICGMLSTVYFSLGDFGAGRAFNVYYATFLLSSIFIYSYFLGLLKELNLVNFDFNIQNRFTNNFLSGIGSLIVLLTIFFMGSNYLQYSTTAMALAEMKGRTHLIYKEQMEQRLELYKNEDIKDIVVEPQIYSVFFGGETLSKDSDWWVNNGVEAYYNKDSVVLSSKE